MNSKKPLGRESSVKIEIDEEFSYRPSSSDDQDGEPSSALDFSQLFSELSNEAQEKIIASLQFNLGSPANQRSIGTEDSEKSEPLSDRCSNAESSQKSLPSFLESDQNARFDTFRDKVIDDVAQIKSKLKLLLLAVNAVEAGQSSIRNIVSKDDFSEVLERVIDKKIIKLLIWGILFLFAFLVICVVAAWDIFRKNPELFLEIFEK